MEACSRKIFLLLQKLCTLHIFHDTEKVNQYFYTFPTSVPATWHTGCITCIGWIGFKGSRVYEVNIKCCNTHDYFPLLQCL